MKSKILTYDSQLMFKKWAMKNGLDSKKHEFYFDYVTAVDATHDDQPDIPGVRADGSMTWSQALAKLKKHFKAA